jgi:hypothetical protein
MTFRQRLRRWWDEAVSIWMDIEDRHPQRVAAISVGMTIGYGALILIGMAYLAWRIA